MKKLLTTLVLSGCFLCNPLHAKTDAERIKTLEEKLAFLTEEIDELSSKSSNADIHLGGYGELHYNNLDNNGEDFVELDLHRFVIFFGYDFNEKMRFISEFEVEHVIASAGNRGAVEIEQAYLEFDLSDNSQLKTGVILLPVGIINETHEPTTFYGVERPVIETTIIPTTWWGGGASFSQQLENGVSYDIFITEGLQTDDPSVSTTNDAFDIKGGKQKTSFASAHDLALTARIKYTGTPGLELAAYAQYQPDLDQSAETSYAESATLIGGHSTYQISNFKATALYARWDLDGDDAQAAGKDVQDGAYIELSYRPLHNVGVFARQSLWSQETDIDKEQTDFGVNYWPDEDIVFKFDIQMQNDDAGNSDGFNLGMGYQF